MSQNLVSYTGICLLLSFILLQGACKKADLGSCEVCRDGMKDKEFLIEKSGPAFDGSQPLISNYPFINNYVCTPNGDGYNDGIGIWDFFALDSAATAAYTGYPVNVTTQFYYDGKLVHNDNQTATVQGNNGGLQYTDYNKLWIDGTNRPEGIYKWVRGYDFFDGSHLKITGHLCSMKGECIDGDLECQNAIRFPEGFYIDPMSVSGFSYDPALAGEQSCEGN